MWLTYRLAAIFVWLCVVVSMILVPVTWGIAIATSHHRLIYRTQRGPSVRFEIEDEVLWANLRGFDFYEDSFFHDGGIRLLTASHYLCLLIPPAIWYAAHNRRKDMNSASRELKAWCGLSSWILCISLIPIRPVVVFNAALVLFAGLIIRSIVNWVIHIQSAPQRRLDRGLCPRCSYCLVATPRRCPECGLEINWPGLPQSYQTQSLEFKETNAKNADQTSA